jgi:hypothetical protein
MQLAHHHTVGRTGCSAVADALTSIDAPIGGQSRPFAAAGSGNAAGHRSAN